ncbi:MAG: TonB-dependent receptor plug domain-containing protein, partial [Salinibacter sp.]
MDAPYTFAFRLCAAILITAGLCLERSAAQTPAPDSVATDTSDVQWRITLPPLTVTASRIPTSPAQAPARVTVFDSLAIRTSGASSVATLLEERAGTFVRRYGATGLATPALRGTGASQTILLLDGQRITDPQIGHLDLSLLPTALLQSVRVMHGPASPLHGSNGLGGAIQLRTVRPGPGLTTRLVLEGGAFGERGGSLLVGGALAPATSALVAADYQSTDGDFPYTDESRFPPATVRRRNADRTRRTLYGSVRSRVGAHRLRLSGWLTRAERGIPPTSSTAPAQARQWDTQLRLWARDRLPLGPGHLSVQGLAQRTRLRYADPSRNLDQTGRTTLTSLEATLRRPVSAGWTVAGGLSGSYARARHPKLAATAHQEHLAAFVEGTAQYGPLTLYPALRTDLYWMPDGHSQRATSPRLGLNWQPIPGRPGLHVKAQVGRAFRVPTFNDRYWQPGGNPTLRPERSWGGDLGVRVDRPHGFAEVTVFGQWRRDQIVWKPTGRGYWAPTNVGRVRALGVEATLKGAWNLSPHLGFRGGLTYTFTDARNRTDPQAGSYNEPLRYVPRSLTKLYSTLSWGPVAFDLNARYTGRRYVTSDGSQFLDAYVLLDAQLRVAHDVGGVRSELSFALDNALDTEY